MEFAAIRAMLEGLPSDDLLLHQANVPFHMSEESYQLVVDACRGCSLIVVDPIIQASRVQDWNAQQEVRSAWEYWRRLARDLDALVVVVAHHRKALGDFGDQIAGSIQGLATPDGVIEVRRDPNLLPNQRRVSYVGRDWADFEDEVIELDPSTLTFTLVGTAQAAKDERDRRTAEGHAEELLDQIPMEAPGKTQAELVEASGLGDKPVRDALKVLVASERVTTTGKAKSRNNPLRYHRQDPDLLV